MKKTTLIFLVSFLLLLAMNAHGATLTYSPESVSLTLAPGSADLIPLFTITMGNSLMMNSGEQGSTFSLMVIADMDIVNLPRSWVIPLASVIEIGPSLPAVPMIMVSVPKGTKPDRYSARLFSKVMGDPSVDPGQGVLLSVKVQDTNPACQETPTFDNTSIGPDVIDVPNNKLLDIQVEGTATVANGCTLTRVWYKIDDEYGEDSNDGDITFADNGNFSLTIPVTASRRGSDEDGRLYQLKLFAENEAGEGKSDVFLIRISHDRSKK